MRLFSRLYDRVLGWAGKRHADWYLGGLSFAESSFFPIPPDVLLAPMVLAQRERAVRLAALTTVTSVLGGLFGYVLGVYALEVVTDLLREAGYWEGYQRVRGWFEVWGFWAVFAAGFSPVPYKLFTVSAGALHMSLPLFLLASLLSRGARFFMVAGLVYWGGPKVAPLLRRYIDAIGWLLVAVLLLAFLVW